MINDILKKIYTCLSEEYLPDREYEKLFREIETLWMDTEEILGEEKALRLQKLECAMEDQSNLEWFREGWRLGLLITLDLLDPISRQ